MERSAIRGGLPGFHFVSSGLRHLGAAAAIGKGAKGARLSLAPLTVAQFEVSPVRRAITRTPVRASAPLAASAASILGSRLLLLTQHTFL
jgi:hypothetical protein